jgi:glycosyltransferase involved in cell wall biosynthesis
LWFGLKAGGSVGHIAGVMNAFYKKFPQSFYASAAESLLIGNHINFIKLDPPKNFAIPVELNYYHFNQLIIKQVIKQFKHVPLQFIYQRLSVANYAGIVASRKLNIPLIIEYNGSEAWIAKSWGKPLRYNKQALQAENACLHHATLIVTISAALKDELISRGVEPKRIAYYPNCVDPNMFNPENFSAKDIRNTKRKHQIKDNALIFTFVGTFGRWHGIEILAQAIKILVDNDADWLNKNNIIFMLIGDGVMMNEVHQIIGAEKYAPFVRFAGLIPQAGTPEYLATSDVLLSPHVANQDGSRFFGSPTKLFEYMAMGKSIIASDLEQIGEVLKDSLHVSALPTNEILSSSTTKLAVLCNPGNAEDIVKGIKFMTENPKWRKQLGLNARIEALQKYSWDKHVATILNQLNRK